jgi:ADP-ribose pyrophosphatase YjhB (NUDIX family)
MSTVGRSSSGVVGLLAEPERLRVVSALALGAGTIPEVAAAAGMDQRAVVRALRRLERGGLVSREKDQLTLHADRFKEAAREAAPDGPGEPLSADPATDAVLRAFTRDGRITSIPVQRARRRLLLEQVAATFEPGVRYPEREVNAILRAWHPDHATLRRYLVDELLLDRAEGMYWRIGGPVDVAAPAPERISRVAAYGLVRDGDRVLLTRLGRSMHKGLWTLPGGGLDFGERPVEAVVRELHEETGLDVRVDELLDADAELYRDGRPDRRYEVHAVRFLYRLSVLGGTLGVVEVDGSTDAVQWWAADELPRLTPLAERVLRTGRLTA